MKRLLVPAALVAILAAVLPSRIEGRAWPRLLMFYGGALATERLHVTDWEEVRAFFESLTSSGITLPADAPFIEVALYWHGPTWEPYIADPALLKTLPLPRIPGGPLPAPSSSEIVNWVQPARLYLSDGKRPPMFDYYSAAHYQGLQPVTDRGVALLTKHKIPTKPAKRR